MQPNIEIAHQNNAVSQGMGMGAMVPPGMPAWMFQGAPNAITQGKESSNTIPKARAQIKKVTPIKATKATMRATPK